MSNIFRLYFEKFSANALPMGKIFAIIREKFLGGGNAHAPRFWSLKSARKRKVSLWRAKTLIAGEVQKIPKK